MASALADDLQDDDGTVEIPVQRLLSRHRRFIAPGAIWDILIGVESIGANSEFRYDLVIHYSLDYLFGGNAALAGKIAGNDAAANAFNTANEATMAALGKKRKRRSF